MATSKPLFKPLPAVQPEPGSVSVLVDGAAVRMSGQASLAAGLLAAGLDICRATPVSGAPRGPFCMMGVCFECLVTVDGVGNRQGCLTPVAEGMQVAIQRGKRELSA